MKTLKCNTGKILRKTSIAILGIIISAGMFAQKSHNSFEVKQYASDLFRSTGEIISATNSVREKKAFYEEEILLEEWMGTLEHWVEKMDTFSNAGAEENKNEEVIQEEFELENWMMDLKEWTCPEEDVFTEEEIELEPWMYDLRYFMENNQDIAKVR